MRCPSCDSENPETTRFCIECGVALEHCCPKCGFGNFLEAKFCGRCGSSLTASAPQPGGGSMANVGVSDTPIEIDRSANSRFRREQAKWAAGLVSAGSLLTLLFQIIYMAFDRRFLSTNRPSVLIFHSLNIALFGVAAITSLTAGPWLRRHSKAIAFAFSCIMIWSSTAIAILTQQIEPIFLMIVLFLAGTGTFLSWGGRIQALLSIVAIAAFVISIQKLSIKIDPYQWLGIAIAAAIGMSSAALLKGLRRARRQAEAEVLKSHEALVRQERLLAEEKLAAVGRLSSAIAHEIRNPVAMISSSLALAIRLGQNEAEREEMFAIAAKEADRLEQLTTDFLAYARPRVLQASRTNVADLLNYVAATARARAVERGVAIKVDANANLEGEFDGFQIRQALLNLVLNAVEACQHDDTVRLRAGTERNGIIGLDVVDPGGPIPPDATARIFEPFFTTKPAGTGLGLAIARNIARAHHGDLVLKVNQPGQVCFSIKIPVAILNQESPTVGAVCC
jgi:two-component system sensor histidine kinase HydH